MDPLCIGSVCIDLSLELGTLIVGLVGAVATGLHHLHHKQDMNQRERHYQDWRSMQQQGRATSPPLDLISSRP